MITINNPDVPNPIYEPRERFVQNIGNQIMRRPEVTLNFLCTVASCLGIADLNQIEICFNASLEIYNTKTPPNILN